MRDRNDAGPAGEPDRRLDPDHTAHSAGAEDGPVSFGAEGDGGKAGDDGGGARAGATGRAIQCIWIAALAAASAPATRGVRGAEIRPLAEVGLSQQYCTSCPQTLHHEGISGRA